MTLRQTRIDSGRLAWRLATAAMFCLPAFALILPRGLFVFAILLVLSTLLAPAKLVAEIRNIAPALKALLVLALAVLALSFASMVLFDLGWRDIDSRTRFLVLPWCALWAYALQPSRSALWAGAVIGLAAALALALWQATGGAVRVHGWNNAIVFAEIVLMLMILAVFCRPAGRWRWVIGALLLGTACIVLSGSRGVWPGLMLVLVVMVLGSGWKTSRVRVLVLGGVVAAVAVLVLVMPVLSSRTRVTELHRDIDRYERGDVDTSMGARLELLSIAQQTFVQHPLTGVGMGRFDSVIQTLPECRNKDKKLCHLGHAHNDLAEWAATLGTPGLLTIIAIYALPLWWFVGLIGASGLRRQPRGAAWAGAMLVVAYILCGQTQSMFAHQLTSSFYAAVVGILMGLSLREAVRPLSAPGDGNISGDHQGAAT